MGSNKNICIIDGKEFEFDAVASSPTAYSKKKCLGKGVFKILSGKPFNDNGKEHYFFKRKEK